MEKKTYAYEEAFKASLEYFAGDELAARVWVNKYAMKDSFGHIYECSPTDMHWRLTNELARIERKYPNPVGEERIFEMLDHFRYIVPAGSPMTGIGNNFQIASLSNCFVVGIDGDGDSYGAILKLDEEQVQLMKRRGGVGHDLSGIRPKGSPVKNSALTSTGIVPFMERYSNSTREVAQDGRRGALMLSISIRHPEAEDFIDAKMQEGKITGANVSVKIDDEFMRCATEGLPYHQQFPIDSDKPIMEKETNAKALWKKIVHNAWKSAEPGVLFWDTIRRESIPDCYADLGFTTVSTNPCGEIPLCPYDSCRLLAINLYSYVEKPFTAEAFFNFDKFREHVTLAQRFMDDIIDLEQEKIDAIIEKIKSDPQDNEVKLTELRLWEKIKHKTAQGRRTGVGITAEGDMIAALGLRYGTEGHGNGRESATDAGPRRLPLEHGDGPRTRCVCRLRCEARGEQPLHSPHQGGRPRTLRGHAPLRPAQHCLPHHRPHGHHEPHDADDERHRTRVHAGLQAPPQGEPERPAGACGLYRRDGRCL